MTTNELLMIALTAAGFVVFAFGVRRWIVAGSRSQPLYRIPGQLELKFVDSEVE